MDFETQPISREFIRIFANLIRKNYKIKTIRFPVLKFLESIENLTNDEVSYIVEDDKMFDDNVMAYIEFYNDEEKYWIHIRETVYVNAYAGKHADIGFIMHEICHYFMIGILGFKPNEKVCYTTKRIPAYKSAEWQAKALCGELMIPYEKCKNKTPQQIYHITKSSQKQVAFFLENVLNKKS